ncbi:DUF1501 domain-containing protein [Sphingomonas sp. RRHST34]|uniref:DUF1501 domain-containing protein n=1 Tax=Sphingomonas citri TaxID=2862499 RepID=A0ABS7BPW3_9SPHN|nr:DUF1501 domain-containing protein [Sphingomonas citri]MBW6531652.1 DUF1501 domain-containing protein [Sphingomonas citri]
MLMSRRHFHRLAVSTSAAATLGIFGRGAAFGATTGGYRAMVGVFLFGGNDGWNMVVPTDPATYGAYLQSRGTVALAPGAIAPLSGVPYGLHKSMARLSELWDRGAMSLVLNTGTLAAPLDKATYTARPDLRPTNLMSHADEQEHWQCLRPQGTSLDGFMGRLNDRLAAGAVPPLMSFAGNNIALIGQTSRPLVVPATGALTRLTSGQSSIDTAVASFADGSGLGTLSESTGATYSDGYAMMGATASLLGQTSSVDGYFVDPDTGAALTTDIANQLKRVARMIEGRGTLGHARQTFFVSQGGYDTHDNQVAAGDTGSGRHAGLLKDLALALYAFYNAMQGLALQDQVTAFTMSDFGRTFKGNAQLGCDHAWGSNHLVIGGGVAQRGVFGRYPDPTLGGSDDISWEGRFLPTTSQEEYIGAILRWHGVSDADMPYVVPNWATWSSNGRAPLALFT